MSVIIRAGKAEDVPGAFALVQELAEYEKAPHEVENTVEQMLADGFGANPVFGLLVAETEGIIVGASFYYFRYSTWKGKRLYLEDFIVTEPYRGKGIGKLLFEATARLAYDTGCNGMSWQVLDWNEPALTFYKKYGADLQDGWLNGSLTWAQLSNGSIG